MFRTCAQTDYCDYGSCFVRFASTAMSDSVNGFFQIFGVLGVNFTTKPVECKYIILER